MKPGLKIALIYSVVGIIWIFTSDKLVLLLFDESELEQITWFQTSKGIFYVLFTGSLLYMLVNRYHRTLNTKITELNKLAVEMKKTVGLLQESERRYSDLFLLSPQPMWVYDMSSLRFVQVNEAAIAQYGFTREEFLEMTILDIRPKEEIDKVKEAIKSHGKTAGIFRGKFSHLKKSGELIQVEIYSNRITLNDKIYTLVIAIDVTEKTLYEHKITRAIIKTQEDERYEIGSELHDNVCQILASSQISLGALKKTVDISKMKWLDQSREYIALALDEIRYLSHRLAPAFFDDTTLQDAFNRLLNTFNLDERYEVTLNFSNEIKIVHISLEVQLNLYRILQEQLKNILKYAEAKSIKVSVSYADTLLKMKIIDDGVGFNVDEIKGGIGFANMKRRAELFAGKLVVVSAPGKGCSVDVEIPL